MTEWWESFFSGLWLDVQRQSWDDEATRRDADTIVKALDLSPGSEVLDVPCGEGRIALELAARGYRVTGVDRTEPLLEDRKFDHTTCRVEVDWTFVRGTERSTHHSSLRLYTYRELTNLLREAGFSDFTAFDRHTLEPFRLGARRLLMVAHKR